MLMDSTLLETLAKADEGDNEALYKIASAYLFGEGTKQDFVKAREYMQRLADKPLEEKEIYKIEYGMIFSSIGDLFYDERNFKRANEYYLKARYFIWNVYEEDFAEELSEAYEIEKMIGLTAPN